MLKKKYLILRSNDMDVYTLGDIQGLDQVLVIHRKKAFGNAFVNLLYNIHTSLRIQKHVDLPGKGIWDRLLFDKILKRFVPDYIILTFPWFSPRLISYFRSRCRESKIILRFTDKIRNEIGPEEASTIARLFQPLDGVLVYNQMDALKYGLAYHSVGYSIVDRAQLKAVQGYDVVFIGAEKGRIHQIRQAYRLFRAAGLSCFFYVTFVKESDRRDDGIVYADRNMSFPDYLAYEASAKCLLEIVQEGSSGRTYRMMESIMYNKLLITNCDEVTQTDYYVPEYVQLYQDVADIDPFFVARAPEVVDYRYKGDFSPRRVLEFVENKW